MPHKNTINATRRPVKQFDMYGTIIQVYPSIREAARILDLDAANIAKVCKGTRKSHGGFRWTYVENYKPLPLEPTRTGKVKSTNP